MVELQALGPLELRRTDGDGATVLTRPKGLALLSYLVLARPRGYHRRDTLLALLWPELDQTRGRKALSQALFILRRNLPDGVVLTRGTEEVGLATGQIWCDALVFEDQVVEGRWAEALALYRGELMAGFHVAGSPDFGRWLELERDRLRNLAGRAAWSHANELIQQRELVEAERTARQALELVPTDESPVRAFILSLATAGDRAAALSFYERYRTALDDVLGVEPASETESVADRVRAGILTFLPQEDERNGRQIPNGQEKEKTGTPADSDGEPDPNAPDRKQPARAGPPKRSGTRIVGAISAVATLSVILGILLHSEKPPVVEHRLAVVPFENRTGDESLDELGVMAADWITRGLTTIDTLQVVPISYATQAVPGYDGEGEGIPEISERTGAGLLLTGSIVAAGDSLEYHAQLIDPVGGRILDSYEPQRAPRSDPTAALTPIRREITGRVALRLDDRFVGLASVTDPNPPDFRAYRAYMAGVELFFDSRYAEAIRELDRAMERDSTFLDPGIWVASAFGNMGDYVREDSVRRLLESQRASLSPVSRVGLDIIAAQLRGDNAAIYRLARERLKRRPSTEGRLLTGAAAYDLNRLREAVQVLQSEPEDGPARGRLLYFHSMITDALHFLGDHGRELQAAGEARGRFPDRVEPTLWKSRALIGLDRLDEARRAIEEGMTIPSSFGSAGYLQVQEGLELRRHGYLERGEEVLRRGIAWYEGIQRTDEQRSLLARALLWAGESEEAVVQFRQLWEAKPDDLDRAGYLGLALAACGRAEEAREVDTRLASWSDPYLHGRDLYWRATIAAELGSLDQAMDFLRDALAQGVSHASLHENEDLRPLWVYPPFQVLLEPRN